MFFAYMNQLLLCPDFTDICLLAIWFSVEVLGNRQILYDKNVSIFIWICPSIGIRPEMMYGTISGAFCGSERICFTILLWNFSSFSRFFLSGVITSRPYNKVRMTYPCMSSLCVYKYLGLVHYCRESLLT